MNLGDASALVTVLDQVQVEDFKDAELMLDITEHTLVPEHQVGTLKCRGYQRSWLLHM